MTSRTLTVLAAATLGIAGFASGQMAGQPQATPPDKTAGMNQADAAQNDTTGAQATDAPMAAAAKITDKDFVRQAASAGHYEVDAAKLVQGKVSDPQIKQLAQTMQSDHMQVIDELKKIAKQSNIDVPGSAQGDDQRMLSQLKQTSEQQLGQRYLKQQIEAHQKSIDLFKQAQTQLQDEQLKSFAQRTLPKLEQHLQHLQQMASGAQPAGGAMPGAMDNPPASDKQPMPDNAPMAPKQP